MRRDDAGFRTRAAAVIVALVVGAGIGLHWTLADSFGGGLGPFVLCFSAFHLTEFFATLVWRRRQLSMASFAFNGRAYALAVTAGLVEYGLEAALWEPWSLTPTVRTVGLLLVTLGMGIRIWAMVTARDSFNHIVQTALSDDHRLVESGPYRWLRHPSYTGYYWYAIGTQVALLNPVVVGLYAVALAMFFRHRIAAEEAVLLRHFGARYQAFRSRRRLLIPGA